MNINTDYLQAFLRIYELSSFTEAAKSLGISQSALSQKIHRLEDHLQATLLLRAKGEIKLTSAGEKLLVFAKQQTDFEKEFLRDFNQYSKEPSGVYRIAAFSSITRSVVIPSLSNLMRKYKGLFIEFNSYEVIELEDILRRNQADLIITDYSIGSNALVEEVVGKEEYVLIESSKFKNTPEVYLDHGPHDNATESFFNFQKKNINYKRNFMGDVYNIIEGVEQGIGKAIMSKHLIKNNRKIKISNFKQRYFRDIYMVYSKRNYYSPIHELITDEIANNAKSFL